MASFSATQLACASFSLCVSSCFVFGGRTGGGGRKWEEVVVFLASPPADVFVYKENFLFPLSSKHKWMCI